MNKILTLITFVFVYLYSFTNYSIDKTINDTLLLINEEMVASSITEHSKLEAYEYNEVSYLVIDQQLLKKVVEETLSRNLGMLLYEVSYYFYDSTNKNHLPTYLNYCNSVQIKIEITYVSVGHTKVLRFEPAIK